MAKLIGTLLKLAIAALIFYAALAIGSSNANATNYPNAVREPAIEARLPNAVTVFCTANTGMDFAYLYEREIYLDRYTCAALTGQPSPYSIGLAVHTLYHEWWHVAFQELNEKNADTGSYAVMRYMLRTYWGYSARVAQEIYAASWGYAHYQPMAGPDNTPDPLLKAGFS